MSDILRNKIREVALQNEEIYSVLGKVKSVNLSGTACTVTPLNGDADILDVRLKTGIGKGMLLVPVVGSVVCVTFLSASEAYVGMLDEVERFTIATKAGLEVSTTDGKTLSIKNSSVDFTTWVQDILKALIQLTVDPNTGKVLPPSITQLTELQSRIKQLLK